MHNISSVKENQWRQPLSKYMYKIVYNARVRQ